MSNYGLDAPATGFTFSLLHLLFALDKVLDERVEPHCDLLIFSTGRNLRSAQKLACRLRKLGYSVSRDILDRSREEALAYARQLDYRYLAVVEDDDQDIELTSLRSGQQKNLSWEEICQPGIDLQV
jgi:ATP phosphoribosyltransferase regulatory subunit